MSFLLGLIFIISSTGIVVFHSYCSCSGKEQISLYTSPLTCEESFHKHHTHDCCGNEVIAEEQHCHECSVHVEDCGCSKPDVKFFKLVDQITNEEVTYNIVKEINLVSPDVIIPGISESKSFVQDKLQNCFSPPPKGESSLDFLIQIHQLKIPFQA